MNGEKVLDISWASIFKIALTLVLFYILFLIRDILVWFIFAVIISVLFDPAIKFLQRFRFPRALASILVYALFFGILGGSLVLTIPMFVDEIQEFSRLFPQYFENLAPLLQGLGVEAFASMESLTNSLGTMLQNASSDIFSALALIFGSIGSTLFVLTIALFLSLEEKAMERFIGLLAPKRLEGYVLSLWERSQLKVAGWFGSRILTCIFVGVAVFITLYLFDVKYSFVLALMAGIFDFIPVIGPFIVAILAFILVAMDSWLKALFVLVALFLIQQIEGNILSPILTKKFVGLPPVLVLVSLAIGAQLLGMLGAILAIPLAGILYEFLRDFLKRKKEEKAVVI
jgi:predicted PurR-regulated permease PerM